MNTREAAELGQHIAEIVQIVQHDEAYALLAPVLDERNRFVLLDRIGKAIGAASLPKVNPFLERVAAAKTIGGWVIIGSVLGKELDRDLDGAFARCRNYIIAGDTWYSTDILGERVIGPALVADFQPSLTLLTPWRDDINPWVRRSVGVGIHVWTKRSRGAPEHIDKARTLLTFLEPMFDEQHQDTVKGVGWGLKTLGRYYPDLVTEWLVEQTVRQKGRYRALILRKALTYLSVDQRDRAAGGSFR